MCMSQLCKTTLISNIDFGQDFYPNLLEILVRCPWGILGLWRHSFMIIQDLYLQVYIEIFIFQQWIP